VNATGAGAAAGSGAATTGSGTGATGAAAAGAASATGSAAPSAATVSMEQIGWPTGTTAPSGAISSDMTPSAGAGISAFTLSVITSAIDSYFAIASPGCFSQRAMVPSVTLSPSCGIVTVSAIRELPCVRCQYAASSRSFASTLLGVTR
jgi:hypothetical protein